MNPDQQQPANTQRMHPCLICRAPMEPLMQMQVRVDGPGREAIFLRGFQELSERILVLDTYRCTSCRRLDFFDLDASLPVQ